jgi:hypothetical protein
VEGAIFCARGIHGGEASLCRIEDPNKFESAVCDVGRRWLAVVDVRDPRKYLPRLCEWRVRWYRSTVPAHPKPIEPLRRRGCLASYVASPVAIYPRRRLEIVRRQTATDIIVGPGEQQSPGNANDS